MKVEYSAIPAELMLMHYLLGKQPHIVSAYHANATLAAAVNGLGGEKYFHFGSGFGTDTRIGSALGGAHVGIERVRDLHNLRHTLSGVGAGIIQSVTAPGMPLAELYDANEIALAVRREMEYRITPVGACSFEHDDFYERPTPAEAFKGGLGHFLTHELMKHPQGFAFALEALARYIRRDGALVLTTPIHFIGASENDPTEEAMRETSLMHCEFAERFFLALGRQVRQQFVKEFPSVLALQAPPWAATESAIREGSESWRWENTTYARYSDPVLGAQTALKGFGMMMAATIAEQPIKRMIPLVLSALETADKATGSSQKERNSACVLVTHTFRHR